MIFWGVVVVLGVGVLALLLRALLQGTVSTPQEHPDLLVYRQQLEAIDADVARGVLAEDEAERGRLEIKRRLLDADRTLRGEDNSQAAPKTANRVMGAGMAVLVLGGGFLLYHDLGAPGYPDMPLKSRIEMAQEIRDSRPSQAEAEAATTAPVIPADPSHIELVEKLRSAIAERPDDIRGHQLLAVNEASLGNYAAAHAAQARVIELRGDEAAASEYSALADMLILAAGGYVSPEAETALTQALRRNPADGSALYYSALMMMQTGRPDMGFAMWRDLLAGSQQTDPWVPPILAQIDEAAMRAGVEYTPPTFGGGVAGPDADDIANASEMDDADRQAMIESMVSGLSDRLATEGGTPEEWAQLIRAQGVLGQREQAAAVWANAQEVFANAPEAVALIRAAAEQAGVVE